jgi:amidase
MTTAAPSARALLSDLDAGRVSARELLEDAVARNEKVHGEINAVVATDLDAARAAAAAVDEARARGAEVGALAGLPMTIKDGYDVRGMPAVVGNPGLVGRAPDVEDADVVATVRAAGAVVWGKTNTPLMLGDVQTFNAVYGTTNNPHDVTRTSGGSSGGAAAALAAGVTSLEIGSDIGGSLRVPAAFCGVLALKPTWDRISMRGQIPPMPGTPDTGKHDTLGVAGPMARDAGDLRLLWDVLSGERSAVSPVAGLRVGIWADDPQFVVSDEVVGAVEATARTLREHGVVVERATLPFTGAELLDTYFSLLFPTIGSSLPTKVHERLRAERPAAVAAVQAGASPYSREANTAYLTADLATLASTRNRRAAMKDAIAAWFGQWDAVLAPVVAIPAFTHRQKGGLSQRVIEVDGAEQPYLHLFDWISLATALQLPAVAVPAGATAAGLPLAAQLIAPWNEEGRLLDLAAALER